MYSSVIMVLLMTFLLGVAYPVMVTVLGQTFFHHRAQGSLIERGGNVMGSSLLGQEFTSPKYFWGRLSATQPAYNTAASSGSNMSPGNPKLLEAAKERLAKLHKYDPANTEAAPVDLVTASASGLDPHVSLAAIEYQLPRVAGARNIKTEAVQAVVDQYTETFGFGMLQEPYVNVLKLNLALDEEAQIGKSK